MINFFKVWLVLQIFYENLWVKISEIHKILLYCIILYDDTSILNHYKILSIVKYHTPRIIQHHCQIFNLLTDVSKIDYECALKFQTTKVEI